MLMRKPGPVKAQSFLKLKPGWGEAAGQCRAPLFRTSVSQPHSQSPPARCWEALCCPHSCVSHKGDISPPCFGEGTAAPPAPLPEQQCRGAMSPPSHSGTGWTVICRGVLGLSGTIGCTPWDPTTEPCFYHPYWQENPHPLPTGPAGGLAGRRQPGGPPLSWARVAQDRLPGRCMSSGEIPAAGWHLSPCLSFPIWKALNVEMFSPGL